MDASPTIEIYSAAITWFRSFEEYLRTSSPNRTEVVQHLDMGLQYVNSIKQFSLESQEHCIPLEHIQKTFSNYKTMLMRTPEQQLCVKESEECNKLYNLIENVKSTPKCTGLKDIAGYHDVKRLLNTVFVLPKRQPQLYTMQKVSKTLLLFGPPGTGKTQLAHALAAEIQADIYCVTASTIMSSYIGETEKMVETLFTVMRNVTKPSVLFIDEIDGICQSRHSSESSHTRRLKTEIMCHMSRFGENHFAYLICATNCPWDIDTAFMRRFNNRIYIPLPNKEGRMELLKFFTKDTPLQHTCMFWDQLLDKTEGFSCSDLQDLIKKALMQPIIELGNVTIWKYINNQFYTPNYKNEFSENLRFCSLSELPDGTVKSRDVVLEDLIQAARSAQRTVSPSEEGKFKEYIQL